MIVRPRDACLGSIVVLCIYAQLRMTLDSGAPPAGVQLQHTPQVARVEPLLATTSGAARGSPPVSASPPPPNPPPPPPPPPSPLPSPVSSEARPTVTPLRDSAAVHVVLGADREHWAGVIGVINSVRRNCAQPERLRLHVLVPEGAEQDFGEFLRCHEMEHRERLQVLGFDDGWLPKIKVKTQLTNLESPLNFARFYLHRLLPGVAKVLYLDADVIVQGDVAELLDRSLRGGELCAATLRKSKLGTKGVQGLKGEKLQARFERRYGKPLPLEQHGFNAGVFVFNLERWAAHNLTDEAEWWIEANTKEQLYMLGSQPPLTLTILGTAGSCQEMPVVWHLDCLGCMGAGRLKTDEELAAAKLLHWNGPNKPFRSKGKLAHAELFRPYAGRGDACRP